MTQVDRRALQGAARTTAHSRAVGRRTFTAGALALAAAPAMAQAQAQGQRVRRIGALTGTSMKAPANVPLWDAWREGLKVLGWVDGRNLAIEYREANGAFDRLPALAAELVAAKVELIFAPTSNAAEPAHSVTQTIPIVFAVHADPIGSGLVKSLARPGGNATGLSNQGRAINAKSLDILVQAFPETREITVLWTPSAGAGQIVLDEVRQMSSDLKVGIHDVAITDPGQLESVFDRLDNERRGPIAVINSALLFANMANLGRLALLHKLPMIAPGREYAEAGAMMAYGASFTDLFRRAARYADRILRGTKPADLPVELAERFDFVLNLKTARALGLDFPPATVIQATEVIE